MSGTNVKSVEILPTSVEADEQVEWYFNAVAGNGEIVMTSETYTTKHDAKRGAEGVFPEITPTIHDQGVKDVG